MWMCVIYSVAYSNSDTAYSVSSPNPHSALAHTDCAAATP